jgi:hypothetical protein
LYDQKEFLSPQTDLNLLMTVIVSDGLPYGRRLKPGGTASVSADSAFACDPELAFVESVSPDSRLNANPVVAVSVLL